MRPIIIYSFYICHPISLFSMYGQYSRAVSIQERVVMAHIRYIVLFPNLPFVSIVLGYSPPDLYIMTLLALLCKAVIEKVLCRKFGISREKLIECSQPLALLLHTEPCFNTQSRASQSNHSYKVLLFFYFDIFHISPRT